jgi:hypothetical protein
VLVLTQTAAINFAPEPDVATARFLLSRLLADPPDAADQSCLPPDLDDGAALAPWLIAQGLGPLAYSRCRATDPALARALQPDMLSAIAESSLQLDSLGQIGRAFQAAGLPLVLLKGAALAQTVYNAPAQRTMSDVDLWLRAEDMPEAARVLGELGYQTSLKDERPFALQHLSQGEIRFVRPDWRVGLVETHWSPFPGWWLRRTAAIDDDALWARLEPAEGETPFLHLAAEDMVIHLAVHTAVNHQFGMSALRCLVDIALTAQKRGVDWRLVAERAKEWRVGTAVYLTLALLDQLIGAAELSPALLALRPTSIRRALLDHFVTPQSVLAGRDLRHGWQRYLLLLLLVDRPRDAARLIYRTLWPEKEWLAARYGRAISRPAHWWRLLRHREL